MSTLDWAITLGEEVARARRRAHLSQRKLADQAGISKPWLSKIERGLVKKYPHESLGQLRRVLGDSLSSVQEGIPGQGDGLSTLSNVAGRLDETRPLEARRLPVFRWGAAGDPRNQDSSPDADHEEYPPVGRESLVGPNGFGVLVRGESMARHGIHDNDVVWINPDRPYRMGRPVLARVWNGSGHECGMVVKILRRNDEQSDRLWGDDGEVQCGHFDIIGPVVGISPAFRLPD